MAGPISRETGAFNTRSDAAGTERGLGMIVDFGAEDRVIGKEGPAFFRAVVIFVAAGGPGFCDRVEDGGARRIYVSEKNLAVRQDATRSVANVVPARGSG